MTLTVTVVEAENGGEVVLVPVMVTTSLPVLVPVEMRRGTVALPPEPRVNWELLSDVCKPQAQPLTRSERFTVPLNPPRLVSVKVDCVDESVGTVRAGGRADMVKLTTRMFMGTWLVR